MGRNLHIEKVFIASRDYRGIKNKVVSKELLEVAGSFEANMIRVEMLLRIFLDVIVWALDFQRLSIKANLTIFNTIEPSLEQSSIDHLNRHRAEFNRLLNELIEQFTTNREKVLERAFQMSWGNLDVFTSYFPDEIILGFESMLSSMVIGSWTAFEVLAADLWEACLNARPRLGVIALNAEPESADEDLVDGRTRGSKYSIPVHLLPKWGFNFQNKMGTLLRGKWDFAKRDDAISAYLKVFRDSKGKESKELSQILRDQNLVWLDALRNVLVHNAGIADARFIRRAKRHPMLNLLKEKEPILLDGELLLPFINTVVQRGIELIKFVDNWLAKNPN